jgi:2-C-methyl-D-erythritol 4-phosphate cytidylyltransferase
MEVWAIIVAGGMGTRFGAPKQFADLGGRPLVSWSLAAARQACDGIVLVLPAGGATGRWDADVTVSGGATRSKSVRAGLAAVPATADIVAVHDAARPLARPSLWEKVVDAVAAGADGAVPASPVTDTVKEIRSDGRLSTLDRERLVAVQTPQAFRAAVLREAHLAGEDATDDASMVEAIGGRIALVDGPPDNVKVTSPLDLVVAAALASVVPR